MLNKVKEIMENVRMQKEIHGVLSEAKKPTAKPEEKPAETPAEKPEKKAPAKKPAPAKSEPAPEPKAAPAEPKPEPAPEPKKEEPAKDAMGDDELAKGVASLLTLLQEYASALLSFHGEIRNGGEKLKQEILDAVKNEIAKAQGGAPSAAPPATGSAVKPPIKKV